MALSYDVADERYAGIRNFRNVLIASSIALTGLVLLLSLVGFFAPQIVNVCFEPPTSAIPTSTNATRQMLADEAARAADLSVRLQRLAETSPGEAAPGHVCPSSSYLAEPSRIDLAIVAMMGLLGGALSASIAVQQMPGTSTQYSVPLALTILKLPAGAMTAIIGLILVRGAFIPGLSNLDTQGQILAWSVLLGFAQHLVTRTIDHKAQNILDGIPTKEGAARTETTKGGHWFADAPAAVGPARES